MAFDADKDSVLFRKGAQLGSGRLLISTTNRLTFMKFSMINRRFIATNTATLDHRSHRRPRIRGEGNNLTQDDDHQVPEPQETRGYIGIPGQTRMPYLGVIGRNMTIFTAP